MEKLLNEYNFKISIILEDIVDFHFRFERIHPFGYEDEFLSKPAIYRKNNQNCKVSEAIRNLFLWYNVIKVWWNL
jgi:hypothetical protein